jgi:hypothetical protein
MITIKEIIALVKHHGLQDAVFIPEDSSNTRIVVREGKIWFSQPCVDWINIDKITEEEIEKIDLENDYYTEEVWKEICDAEALKESTENVSRESD